MANDSVAIIYGARTPIGGVFWALWLRYLHLSWPPPQSLQHLSAAM